MKGCERPGCRPAVNGLEDWCFHFQVVFFVQIIANGGYDLRAFYKNIADLRIHNQVNIALPVALFRIGKCVVDLTVFFLHNGQGTKGFGKDFRNEGMDRFHNPEFTQVELYVAYKDYLWMMELVEEMIEKVVIDLYVDTKVTVGENTIDFKRPWKRYTMYGAIDEFTGIDISAMGEEELFKTARDLGVEVDKTMGRGKLIDEIFGETVESKLIQPTFITDYPVEMSPLAKKHRDKEGLVERFEAIINGKELCNAFSELNDPIDQRERFEEQVRLGKRGDEEAMVLDEDFLRALEYGMPPTAGLGIGIDRLVMTLTNSASIQDVIFFPQMKPEKKEHIDPNEKFIAQGVPKEWIEPLKALGFTTVAKLKEIEKPGKLANDLNGHNKKNKLGLSGLSPEAVSEWLS